MRRIGSTNAGCLVTSSTRSPSRYTARPSRRLATYASPLRIGGPTLPQAAGNDKRRGPPAEARPQIRDNVRHREAPAPRRRARRPRDAGARGALPARLSRVRRRGARARTRRGHRAGRALASPAARDLGDRGARRPVARGRAPAPMTHAESPTWRIPPRWVLLVAVLSIVAAEVGGGSMARFKGELTPWARAGMLAHPTVP